MRQTQKFAENDCIFISVARLAPVKNPQGLLRAFEKILPNCPQAKLVYVGEGEERNALLAELVWQAVILAGPDADTEKDLGFLIDGFIEKTEE